ncbi:MAG TPA: lanthionine synthetase C family protein [Thermoanaerobaculia bacterium]|nr:lanthionine synthetase C family protein [Thermoanaerobaculia bacterium]
MDARSSSPPGAWQSLLTGETARRALTLAEEIAAGIATALQTALRPAFSLQDGLAGIALFFAYLHQAHPGRGHDDTAVDLLGQAVDAIGGEVTAPLLYSGFSGVAWVVEHLEGRLLDPAEADHGEAIAHTLNRYLARPRSGAAFDLMTGACGYGVYALERGRRPLGAECLRQALDLLAARAERLPDGIAWRCRPEHLPPATAAAYPEGAYNLGIAHGVPGAVAFLAEAWATGEAREVVRPLVEGAVAWLQGQRLPPGERSVYPYFFAPGAVPIPTRLAWCYGDLSIAAALLLAGRRVGVGAWEHEARALAGGAAARPCEDSGVVDAGLCHGAAGIAHLFNRLFQATGEPTLAAAARRWLERALELRRPGRGIAGFEAWGRVDLAGTVHEEWTADPGLLNGAAGVGLALLAAATPIAPDWDRVMLLALPPEPRAPQGP